MDILFSFLIYIYIYMYNSMDSRKRESADGNIFSDHRQNDNVVLDGLDNLAR